MNSVHAHEMLVQDLTAQIELARKTGDKAKKLQANADAEGDLADTISTRDADHNYLNIWIDTFIFEL